ncbi:MAG: universal stress protein [Solirubrobacterales bacterium]|nr:universal stress protein [Solirubrobacterales bacterium]
MFVNVIAGVDGFDGGRDAVALAMALGRGRGRLTLVTAYPADRRHSPGFEAVQRAEALRVLEAARMEAGVEAELLALPDRSPARALHQVAEERVADLVVLGSAHHGPLARIVLGDVGRVVVHGAPCPVAIAPKRFRGASPRTIGVGYDGSRESRTALEVARRLAEEEGSALTLYVVYEIPPLPMVPVAGSTTSFDELVAGRRRWAQELLDEALAGLPARAAGTAVRGRPAAELEAAAAHHDLFVVGSRSWGPVRRVVLGSTSDHVAHHAPCPVLVVPRPAEAAAEPVPTTTTAVAAG